MTIDELLNALGELKLQLGGQHKVELEICSDWESSYMICEARAVEYTESGKVLIEGFYD